MRDVIERLEAAGPDEEDQAVLAAIEYARSQGWIDDATHDRAMTFWGVGAYLDAALTLRPEGCWWLVGRGGVSDDEPEYGAQIRRPAVDGVLLDDDDVMGDGESDASPAAALCIAALRAREAG